MANAAMEERTTPPMMMRGVLVMVWFRRECMPFAGALCRAPKGKATPGPHRSQLGAGRVTLYAVSGYHSPRVNHSVAGRDGFIAAFREVAGFRNPSLGRDIGENGKGNGNGETARPNADYADYADPTDRSNGWHL